VNSALLISALRTTVEYLANGLTLSVPIFFGSLLLLRLFFRESSAATRYQVIFLTFLAVAATPLLVIFKPAQPAEIQSTGPVSVLAQSLIEEPVFPRTTSLEADHSRVTSRSTSSSSWFRKLDWRLVGGALWVGAVLTCLIRLALALVRLRQLHTTARRLPTPAGLIQARRITIATSSRVSTPVAIGLWSPKVLLPSDFQERFSVEDQAHVLRHEIAHLERFDDWSNLVLQLILAFFPMNLFLWSLRRRLRLEQEIACDDWAIAGVNQPREYAKLLTRLAAGIPAEPALASGVSRDGRELYRRVARVLDETCNRSLKPSWSSALFVGLGLILFSGAALFLLPGIVWVPSARAGEIQNTRLINRAPVLSSDVIALLKSSALNDTDSGVRRDAVSALANAAGDEATAALLALLDESKDEQLKVLLLRELNGERVGQSKVKDKLNELATREPSISIRVAALGALAKNLDDNSIAKFVSIYRTSTEPSIKQSCLRGLAGSTSKTAKDFLMSVVKDDPDPVMRRLALRAVSDSIGKGVRLMIRTDHPMIDGRDADNFSYRRVHPLDNGVDETLLNPGSDLLGLPLELSELQDETLLPVTKQLQGKFRVFPGTPPEESTVRPSPNRDDK
jgi:beta-lactamase regulating signal transducer with metallopeptidase domain